MNRIRFVFFVLIGFVTALFSTVFSPGTFVNRILSVGLCSILSFNSTRCTANLAMSSGQVVAATPPAIEFSVDNSESNLSKQNTPRPQSPKNSTDVNSQLKDDEKKLDFSSKQGCRIIEHFTTVNGQAVPKHFEYISKDKASCGESFTARLSPDGKTTQVTMKSGEDLLVEQIYPKLVRITFTDRQGKKTGQDLEIPNELLKIYSSKLNKDLDKNNQGNLNEGVVCQVIKKLL